MTQNGGKVDFTVTGHLPPSQKRKRSKHDKLKLTKTDMRRSVSSRPSSVPVSSQWDENNPLSIQSIPIPLSSRGNSYHRSPLNSSHFVQKPKSRGSSIDCTPGRLSSSSTSALNNDFIAEAGVGTRSVQTDRSHHSSSTRHSLTHQSETVSRSCKAHRLDKVPHSKSDGDFLGSSSESIPEVLDESVGKLSSEIDSILHDINLGLIVGSPPPPPNDDKGHYENKTELNQKESAVLQAAEEYLQSNHAPPTQQSSACVVNNDCVNGLEVEEKAAVTIQEWFRECRNKRLKKELREVDACTLRHQQELAALRIQKWFRNKQQQRQQIKLRGLLQEKREEMDKYRLKELSITDDKEERRALKMQAARKQAIEALKKKREEEKKEKELIIQQEMMMLEQTGAVKRLKSSGKNIVKSRPKVAANFNLKKEKSQPESQSQSNSKLSHNIPQSQSDSKLTQGSNSDTTPIKTGQSDDQCESSAEKQPKATEASSSVESNVVDDFFKGGPRKTTPRQQLSPAKDSNLTKQQASTTVSDIFATLKELEEDPPPLPGVDPTSPSSVSYLSKSNLQLLQHNTVATTNISDQKLQTILSYLDDIQRTEHLSREEVSKQPNQESVVYGVNVPAGVQEDLSQQLEAASAVANDVTTTIVTQRMELENKNKTIDMLQKALNQQRDLTVYHTKEMEKESQKRLELQKQEYEGVIGRHQCFIDQLIDDKKSLSDKCEGLVKDVKEMDKKHKTKIATMENTHAAELEKLKQTTVAAEKLRRERWRAEETQRIKEATVKSLEPEIQRIIARGKAEIQKLKAMHEAELLQADERASRRFLQQTEELRVQCAQEKEKACQHERELARQKYEQLAEQEEQSNQQLRRKLYSEIKAEKDKLSFETTNLKEEIAKELKELKESHQLELARIKMEHETATSETQRRHMSELRNVKESATIEKLAWEENYIRKQDTVLLTKEREMRERLRRERDMEIETVIQRLEAETAAARDECERTSDSRVKRIREKYETELKEVEKSERNTLEKFNTMKNQLTQYEGDIIRLRSQLQQKEEEVERVNEVATRLTKERDRVADVVRQEFVDRLTTLEEENRHLKLEISEIKSRHSLELSRKEREKERELEEVHHRVKEALAKKEDNYRTLRSQHEGALKRADHLEMLLEQQRKQLLKR